MLKAPKRIIQIIWHDSGRMFGCYGHPAPTRNINRIACEGVVFENHFSCGTVCIPSRLGILTGNYMHNARACYYRTDVRTLPRVLSAAGYRTIRCGFAEEKEYPVVAGAPPAEDISESVLGYEESYTESPAAADVADRVCALLENSMHESLMYIHAAFREAHGDWTQPVTEQEAAAAVYPAGLPQLPDTPEARRVYTQFLKDVLSADEAVGRILDKLDALGLAEDTLVFFTSDHGIDFPRAKQTCYDAGIGVPLVIRGPGLSAGSRVKGLSSHVDLLPTLCELVNQNPPENIAGVSLLPMLSDSSVRVRDHIFASVSLDNPFAPVRALRTETHKLIINYRPGWPVATPSAFCDACGSEIISRIYGTPRPETELYDLRTDPCELRNLAELHEYAETVQALRSRLESIMKSGGDEPFTDTSLFKFSDDPSVRRWERKEDGSFVYKTC